MCELTRSFTSRDALIVTPVVEPLPIVHLGGEWAGSGESRARSVSAAGEDDVATREYRHGDDLRRVHWRSTAKQGELMVRREEQPWQSRCTLLLDTRSIAHRGEGMTSSFEWAVSAAASVGVHLSRRGYAVRLVLDTGATIASASHDPGLGIGQFEGALLDALAVVQPSGVDTIRTAAESLRRGGGDGLVVAVLGAMRTDEAQTPDPAASRNDVGRVRPARYADLVARRSAVSSRRPDGVRRLVRTTSAQRVARPRGCRRRHDGAAMAASRSPPHQRRPAITVGRSA